MVRLDRDLEISRAGRRLVRLAGPEDRDLPALHLAALSSGDQFDVTHRQNHPILAPHRSCLRTGRGVATHPHIVVVERRWVHLHSQASILRDSRAEPSNMSDDYW